MASCNKINKCLRTHAYLIDEQTLVNLRLQQCLVIHVNLKSNTIALSIMVIIFRIICNIDQGRPRSWNEPSWKYGGTLHVP